MEGQNQNLNLNRKIQYTRMVLSDGLIELMKAKPFEKITVKELCERANVNRSTFYTHYEDIYALLRSIEEETLAWERGEMETLLGKWEEGKRATIRSLERLFECFVENRKYLQVLMSEKGSISFQKKFFFVAYQMNDFPAAQSRAAPPFEKEMRFLFVVNGGVGIVQHWLKTGMKESPRAIAEILYDIALSVF
ncbi:MAG: TetR/AcrR family transcriptional regulator [Oscillospiraceae bacterium]|nr:TetR/AcrR family transcriptional regulator [Oscillospiraceae bacterium]